MHKKQVVFVTKHFVPTSDGYRTDKRRIEERAHGCREFQTNVSALPRQAVRSGLQVAGERRRRRGPHSGSLPEAVEQARGADAHQQSRSLCRHAGEEHVLRPAAIGQIPFRQAAPAPDRSTERTACRRPGSEGRRTAGEDADSPSAPAAADGDDAARREGMLLRRGGAADGTERGERPCAPVEGEKEDT